MNEQTANFVRQHADDDVRQLALRGCKDTCIDMRLALQQIKGLQTTQRKMPSWARYEGLLFPPQLNMEQCSSEQTARYKADLCRRIFKQPAAHTSKSGTREDTSTTLADLTGGLGVDFAFMSEVFGRCIYVERDVDLFNITRHNLSLLGIKADCYQADAIAMLGTLPHVDLIYLDPARRDDHGARTYSIGDCTPNVLTIEDQLLERADYVLLKLSPMLDWRQAVSQLGGHSRVAEVHIVATNGECKELLLLLGHEAGKLTLHCVNDHQRFMATEEEIADSTTQPLITATPQTGMKLFEPNATLMKAGCFNLMASRYGVRAIARNSHLFVGHDMWTAFPVAASPSMP